MKTLYREVAAGRRVRLHIGALLLLAPGLVIGTFAQGNDDTVFLSPYGSAVEARGTNSLRVSLPFYVHNNAVKPPPRNFAASGYMGDVSCLRVMGGYTNVLQAGTPCIKVVYVPGGRGGWAGLVWQNPADNWGSKPDGGYNLSYARRIEFSARGQSGGEIVEFKMGGAGGEYPDSATVSTGPITLKNEWKRYALDLSDADLSYISTGFGFVVTELDNPKGCVLFVDQVGYFE